MKIKIENTSQAKNGYQERDNQKPPKKKGNQVNTKSFREYLEEMK